MTKLKTRRSAAKRFSFTGTGKIKRRRAGHRHNMTAQPKKAKTLARK
ncbi:MAG: 50S ribosomal protein L35, partial [Geminicoccaceae bacterium]|nr:50S ribosomal protein L35 [Geminicoccaceae bacterium]